MAKKGSFSKVYDKNGDYVDVEAARFDGTRSFQIQGDVTASQTWNGDPSSPLTLNASIGAKKVTTDKINDKAVQAKQIDDGAVGLTQIATTAMNGTVQDNDSKLATHAAVKTYVDSQISGQGTYFGKHTVAEINAMVTDNLHNGDRVMTSDSGTINLGPGGLGFDVEAGEDLILYKSGSTVQWDSMDGNFKTKQSAVVDPTASGSTLEFIDSITQDENGEITASKKAVQDGTTSQKGVVQLAGSIGATVASENNKAASEKAVRDAINALDSNATSTDGTNVQVKVTETDGKISAVNITTDNTENKNNKVTSFQSTPDNTHYPSEKLVKDSLDAKAESNKVIAIADAYVTHGAQTGDKWFKIAEASSTIANTSITGLWKVYAKSPSGDFTTGQVRLTYSVGAVGSAPVLREFRLISDLWSSKNNNIKVVCRGLSGNITIEIWINTSVDYSGFAISELQSGVSWRTQIDKSFWTYTSYVNSGGSSVPVTDIDNNVVVSDITVFIFQFGITSPTNNNLVAMDESGLVKDSGIGSGTLSTALTKLDGIAEGAEANVQADWDVTDSSSDAFIKNKPFYHLPSFSSETIVKVCTFALAGESSSLNGESIEVLFRQGNFACIGSLTYKTNAFVLLLKNIGNVNAQRKVVFYYVIGTSNVTIYANVSDYTQLSVAPKLNLPKARVDFTDFGTTATLPEGATEITPVWVANSASSSGTAPVKVDAYGALTACTVDTAPTDSSTNLVTSGGVKSALDLKSDKDGHVEIGDGEWVGVKPGAPNNIDACYWKVCSFNVGNYWSINFRVSATNRVFDDGVYEDKIIEMEGYSGEAVGAAREVRICYFKKNSTRGYGNIFYYDRSNSVVTIYVKTASKPDLTQFLRLLSVTSQSSITNLTWYSSLSAGDQPESPTKFTECFPAVKPGGSSSVPVYVNSNGEVNACTDDFVHDGDVKSTYYATGTDPVNGTAVAAALGTLDVTDTAVSHQFVTAVSETDGKVSISRAQPVISDVDGLQTALDGKEGSITWMTDQEARSIWANAKAAVAAS